MFENFAAQVTNAPAPAFWMGLLVGLLAAGAAAWGALHFLQRKRVVEDTPTAKLRSAPQGYIEIQGTAELMDGDPIIASLSLKHCVWYSYKVQKRDRDHHRRHNRSSGWRTIDSGKSDELFYLNDGTGRCAIDPEGAKVTPTVANTWYGSSRIPGRYHESDGVWWAKAIGSMTSSYRYMESRIDPGDPIYALGDFNTHGSGTEQFDKKGAVGDLLREWKRDNAELLKRFDADGDGQIDMQEWDQARAEAEKEVLATRAKEAPPPPIDLLSRTRDRRRPFVIASGTEEALVKSCRMYAAGLTVIAVPLLVMALWALSLRLS